MLFADEDEMEREIRLKTLCVEGEDEIATEIKSNREALKTAEKLLEYAMRGFLWFFQNGG